MSASGRGNYLGADDALDDDCGESCTWCRKDGAAESFEGRSFCDEDCINAWWYEWGPSEWHYG